MAGSKHELVQQFERIRDIPYRIPLSVHEKDQCCSGKARELLAILHGAGYEAQYRVGTFRWSALGLPQELITLPHIDTGTHVYVEVKIGEEWKSVDPTWDKALTLIFPVSEWDGRTNTRIAVPILSLSSLEESKEIMDTATNPEHFEEDMQNNGAFYSGFNNYVNKIRS